MSNIKLTNVNYFDSDSKQFVQVENLVIKDGIITNISSNNDYSNDIFQIDCSGKYVIPGLIDAHIHFFQSAGLFTRPDGLDLRHIKSYEKEVEDIKNSIETLFKRYLACGVTGVVDCGGPFWNFEVKRKGNNSEIAPEIAVAGPLVSTISREKLDLGDPPIIKAEDEKHARQLVKNCVKKDPVFVKLWFIYDKENFENHSKIMAAAIDETNNLGYQVAVHATELETAKRAINYGAKILVHSVFDEEVDDAFVKLLLEKEVIYIPTIMVRNGYRDVFRARIYLSGYEQEWGDSSVISSFNKLIYLNEQDIPESHRNLRDEWDDEPEDLNIAARNSLKKLHEAGVIIATGTDAGNVGTLHGPAIHKEMEHMVTAGMPPEDVILSSTKNASLVMGNNDIGEIKVGKIADLVILDRNPLFSISNTKSIHKVIRKGKIFNPDNLVDKFEPVDLIDKQVKAYNSRDLEKFLSYYHPHIQIFYLQSGELLMDGLDEMRENYSKHFEMSPNLHANIVNRIALNELVIDHEVVSGFRGDNTVEAIAYYEVKHQVITRVWFTSLS